MRSLVVVSLDEAVKGVRRNEKKGKKKRMIIARECLWHFVDRFYFLSVCGISFFNVGCRVE